MKLTLIGNWKELKTFGTFYTRLVDLFDTQTGC